jgi:hypothetical protein
MKKLIILAILLSLPTIARSDDAASIASQALSLAEEVINSLPADSEKTQKFRDRKGALDQKLSDVNATPTSKPYSENFDQEGNVNHGSKIRGNDCWQ